MVMEAVPSPQCVGREFVRQYYTLLNKAPLHLHRFYSHDSSFVHGGLKGGMIEEVLGQQQIHEKIMELDFHDCKAKILLVDSHRTLENGVVVQVSGELSNNGQPMRRFVQTFVLAPQSAKKYYVRNDIFRYQDDIIFDDEDVVEERVSVEAEEIQQSRTVVENPPSVKSPAPVVAAVPAAPVVNGSNGTDHHVEEEPTVQPEPVATVPVVPAPVIEMASAVEPTPAAPTPPAEVTREPEPTPVPVLAPETVEVPQKVVVEPTPALSNVPPEPKTYANLLKSSPFNGTTPGLPTTLPPFGAARSTPAATPQVNESSPAPVAVNGTTTPASSAATQSATSAGEYPPNSTSNAQRNTNTFPRPGRPPMGVGMGNGRMGPNGSSGPGSYNNRDRDNDRADKERAPSRGSTEEIGEWRHQNGSDPNRERDREFRRYDDNQQVFVGNIPHFATEDMLRELFQQFGGVVDVRIQGKGIRIQNGARAPYYGFVVFDTPEAAEAAFNKKPLLLNGDHRLNVEQKRRGGPGMNGQRGGGSGMGRGGPGGMGMSRGGRMGGGPGSMSMGPSRDGMSTGGRGGINAGPGGRGGFNSNRR